MNSELVTELKWALRIAVTCLLVIATSTALAVIPAYVQLYDTVRSML